MPPRSSRRAPEADFRTVEPAALMLLKGPEDYVATRALDRVRAVLKARHPDLEYTRFDAAEATRGELTTLASPSLFGEPRLIVAEDLAQMNEIFLEDMLRFLDEPADPEVTLVCRHSGGNRGKKLVDALSARGVVVDCSTVKSDNDKLDFVRQEFRAAQRVIHPDAARALVSAAGSTLSDLGSACQQLMRDVPAEITAEHVDKYFGGRVEASAFKVADATFAGRGESALRLYRHAIATGVSPVAVTAALAMKARQVAALVDHRGSQAELAQTLKLAPWQLKQAAEAARRWGPRQAAEAVEAVAQADAEVKGVSRTPEYAVEKAISRITDQLSQ
ncbi:DNA polymerase III subunit delta [Nesterenkonia sphaerica]|uniref:DNA-directed DNA polymerase n=1 Tax=Nesterenkonia sphaerica TaxID=1804988 RepID=A0A5R9ANF1_9MICC|nr:DNA polymerase III subunit delta [Nesterenkonia sphaerica]TLP79357.1 DNA polymerase III subunit delta [Nesterenkonia sphaerica]